MKSKITLISAAFFFLSCFNFISYSDGPSQIEHDKPILIRLLDSNGLSYDQATIQDLLPMYPSDGWTHYPTLNLSGKGLTTFRITAECKNLLECRYLELGQNKLTAPPKGCSNGWFAEIYLSKNHICSPDPNSADMKFILGQMAVNLTQFLTYQDCVALEAP